MNQQFTFDVVIIGSGAAGLSAALHLPSSLKIAILAKTPGEQHSSYWAQGGMAAVLHTSDTVDSHVADTLNAGGGLCRPDAVEFTDAREDAIRRDFTINGMFFDPID